MAAPPPEDHRLAPIRGVSLEQFADLSRQMAMAGVAGPEQVARWMSARGLAPDSWQEAAVGWTTRLSRYGEVRDRYDEHLVALRGAGVSGPARPDVSSGA